MKIVEGDKFDGNKGSYVGKMSILENALASSRIEGYEVTEQIRADCRRLMDGKVDAHTLAAEILARRRA